MSLLDLCPEPRLRQLDLNANPSPGALINFYAAGSLTVRQATYHDSGGITPNANPVVADSTGTWPAIYLQSLPYQVQVTDSVGTVIYTQDQVYGPNYGATVASSFILKDNSDNTKRMRFDLSAITTGNLRTLTVPDGSGTLIIDNLAQTLALKTLTGVAGITMSGRYQGSAGASIVAANDITVGSGNIFTITGNTQINRIATASWQNGSVITLYFTGTPTVKNGIATGGGFAGILLNSAADFVAANNSTLSLAMIVGQWFEVGRKA